MDICYYGWQINALMNVLTL